MRYAQFKKGQHDQLYDIMYEGITASFRGFEGAETRVISRILDKIEAIGEPAQRENRATFALTKTGVVALEDVEFALLLDTLDKVKWTAKSVRTVTRLLDFLAAAPTTEFETEAKGIEPR